MDFVHRLTDLDDTIAAIATPPGEGGIAVIRISGKEAFKIGDRLFSKPISQQAPHTVHFGTIRDLSGTEIDHALAVKMVGPRSYTGEDTLEFQCHGGMLVSKKVLEAVLFAGARLAKPGEFTFRAFQNGKMDLARAESVQKVIHAKNELALQAASHHLRGAFSSFVKELQNRLVKLAAILEAWVDFPEEGIEFATEEEISRDLKEIAWAIEKKIETYQDGRMIDHGIGLCIVGPPNAGKSSLMNALLGKERAIVTPIPGTTRDLLHEDLRIGNLHFRLTDTAGIRETDEEVEKEGIRRSKEALKEADLILLVLDATKKEPLKVEGLPEDKTVVVWNKMDLPTASPVSLPFSYHVHISAKEKMGLEHLQECIEKVIWKNGPPAKDEIILTDLRHKEALENAHMRLSSVVTGLTEKVSPEFLTQDIRESLVDLGTIIGTNVHEDILSSIFSQFCIGK